ncbi:YihY/virulence factor BrkB family protein [Desulforhopalus sp. 52FAK]
MEPIEKRSDQWWKGYTTWLDRKDEPSNKPVAVIRYILRLVFIIIRQFKRNDLSLRSGALTYAILLSMVPMLAMSTAVVKGLGGGDQLKEVAFSYLETLETQENTTPVSTTSDHSVSPVEDTENDVATKELSLTRHLRSAVTQLFDYVDKTNFATLGTIGVIGILLSVIMVLGNIETAMNSIWKVSEGRPLLRKIADYLTLLILLPLSINLAFAASAFINNPKLSLAIDSYIPLEWLQALLLNALPVFFITLSFYVLYIFFPNTKVKTLPALIGAAIAAYCWIFIQNVYISMQVGVAKYNAIYGSFATVPLFLVWIYLSWIFILAGAQIAFAIQNEKGFSLVKIQSKPTFRLSAAFDIMDRIYRAFNNGEQLAIEQLTSALPTYPPQIIESVLIDLVGGGFLTVAGSKNYYLPLFSEHQYNRSDIVATIFGNDAPKTSGGQFSLEAIRGAMQAKSSHQKE